ncbi:MAG: hypothetical protein K6E27_02060 [Eubacterium sp.]|nr:hypothetical protein [Eubacterium sp.]
MINKHSKGKEHTRRPLSVRAIAILMAIAMVLSVLYINNRRNRVEAVTPSVDGVSDPSFIASVVGTNRDSMGDYTIMVPANGVVFSVPADDSGETIGTTTLYKGTDNKYYTNQTDAGAGCDEVKDVVTGTKYIWRTSDGATSNPGTVSSQSTSSVVYLYKQVNYYKESAVFTVENNALTRCGSVTITSYEAGAPSLSTTGKPATFSDTDAASRVDDETNKIFYYGKVSYTVSKSGGTAQTVDTVAAVQNIFNGGISADGSYTITKNIKAPSTAEGTNKDAPLSSSQITADVNLYLLKSFKANDTDGADGKVTLSDVIPTQDVQVSFTTDVNTTSASVAITSGTGSAASAITGTKDAYLFTIPGGASNSAKSPTYTVTLSDGTVTESFTVTVNYRNGSPAIGSEKTAGVDVGGSYVNVKEASATISAVATVDSIATNLAGVDVFSSDEAGTVSTGATAIASATPDESGNVSAAVNLQPGKNTFIMRAKSGLGLTADSQVFKVFYDNNNPSASDFAVSQGSALSGSLSGSTYTVEASAMKDAVIGFNVKDLQLDSSSGSGISTVTVNGNTVTPNASGYCEYTVGKDESKATAGGEINIPISLLDNAGNSSEYAVLIKYLPEKADIHAEFVDEPAIVGSPNNYFKWKGDGRSANVSYSIYTNFELSSIKLLVKTAADSTGVESTYVVPTKEDVSGDYKYKYVVEYKYPSNVSMSLYNLVLTVTSVNSYPTSFSTEVRSVDITKPDVSVGPITDKWYSNLDLSVTVDDGTYSSEIAKVVAEGTDSSEYTDFEGGAFTANVNESTSTSGTDVKFTAHDKAGNKMDAPKTFNYKVDETKPSVSLTFDGKECGEVNGKVLNGDPLILYDWSDSLSGLEEQYFVITCEGSELVKDTTTGSSNKSLATLIGSTPDSTKNYTVAIYAKDVAGNIEDTYKATFKIDNDIPVISDTQINTVAEKAAYSNYYNKDVDISLKVTDNNLTSESGLVVTDANGHTLDVTWTPSADLKEWTGSIKAMAEGEYNITVTATDDGTLSNSWSTGAFVIDKTAPSVTTQVDGKEYTSMDSYNTSLTTGVEVVDTNPDDADVTLELTRKDPLGNTTTSTKLGKGPFPIADDGYYTAKYTVVDKAGNPTTKIIGFTVDGSKPVHNLYVNTVAAKSSKYSNTYSNKVGKFNDYLDQEEYTYGKYFNTDVFVEVAYFDYNISSVTVYDNGTPIDVNWSKDGGYGKGTIAISSEGYHEIKMSSTDKSGNTVTDSGFSAVYFTIDKTEPVINPYLNGEVYTSMTAYTYSALGEAVVVDENMDEDDFHITAIRELPDSSTETTFYSGQYGIQYTQDGFYTIIYTATDKAGNSSTFSYGFTVDTDSPVHNMYVLSDNPPKFSSYKNNYNNPVGVFDSRPSQESYEYGQYYGSDVSVELNVFDYNLDWVYVTDNGAEITPNWTWDGAYGKAVVTLSSEGYHELKMWSKDLSGNETEDTEVGQKVRLYVDKTSPSITTYVNSSLYTEGSGVRYLNTNASVSVSVNDANKDSTDLVRTSKMTPPGGSSSSQTDNIGETTENYSTEADYEVTYVATDLAGNKSATRNVQFRVDKTPPQLSITGDGTSTAKSVAVTFGIKEAFYWDMTSAKYSIYKKAEGTAEALEKTVDFTPRSSNDSQSYTLTDDAEYRFEFSAEDKCGNKTEMKGTLIKDGTAPVIMLSGVSNYDKTDKNVTLNISVDEAFYSSNKVTLTGTRTDIDGKKTNIDFNQFVTNRTKISNLEQLFEEDGIYDITVTSTDKAGNTSSKSLHFTIDTTDPEIGDLSKYDGVKTNKFEWDIDLDDLVKDLTVCDISVYMDGSLYDGTSEIADGSHVLRVEAVDELGHKSFKEVTFVLDTKAPNIIISNVEDGDRLLESTDVTVTVEIDEDILDTVSLNDKSVTVTDNKATLTINSKGKYRINATAHDEAGNTSSTEIEFSFGKQMNIKLIAIIAGAAILLLAILLEIIKRRRDNAY